MPSFLSFHSGARALRDSPKLAWPRELLLWCLPALLCGALARVLLMAHFPYGYLHGDSADFLITANKFLTRHKFVLHTKKAFLGPVLFMLPMLVKIPPLLFVPLAQHLAGLVYTVMAGALVRCWTVFWKYWIVPVTLLVTLNPALLWYEHALISESQYLWCVTALALAGTAYALRQTRPRFVLLLAALLLTAGSRPEGKLYVLFCLLLIPLVYWGVWRKLALFGAVTAAFCVLTWFSSRNEQAGLLLYATVLPLAPETPKSAPDFGPLIAPLRAERIAAGPLKIPGLVDQEKKITGVVRPYLKSKGVSINDAGKFCQRLAIEAALHQPLLLPPLAFEKFLYATGLPTSGNFNSLWTQQVQLDSITTKKWMVALMPRLTGRDDIHSKEDIAAYLQKEFPPLRLDWFDGLYQGWFAATTRCCVPLLPGMPGIPIFFVLGAAGMLASLFSPLRKFHFAWLCSLAFTGFVVTLTGVVNSRYRFVFEPFFLIYLFVLADRAAACFLPRRRAASHD